jgi:hypothetical protein
MKKIVVSLFVVLVLFSVPAVVFSGKTVRIDVLYMNHGPLLSTLKEIKTLFAKYGEKIAVSWHDVDTAEGEKFMALKKIRGHIPLVIWMDDYVRFQLDGKEIIFAGFPTGSGPYFFQGKWTMEDLRKVLDQMTNKPR